MGIKVKEKVKGSGEWWIYVFRNGKRKSKKIGSKKVADKVAAKLRDKFGSMSFGLLDEDVKTVADIALRWILTIKRTRKPGTHERYAGILEKYVLPNIGKLPIAEVRRSDIRDLLLHIDLSASSIALVRDVVSGIMTYAIDEGLIDSNPAEKTGKSITKKLKVETPEPFNAKEVDLFLSVCKKRLPSHFEFFLCAFRTGMRLGELLGLNWGDIDFNGRFILVRRTYRRGLVGSTKTDTMRKVDMSAQLFETITDLYNKRRRDELKSSFQERIWSYEQNNIRRSFKRLLRHAGLREIRLHDIRHTYASLLLSAGVSPVYVKTQLGHSSIKMTVDTYGRWIASEFNKNIVDMLDSASAPDCPQAAPKLKTGL